MKLNLLTDEELYNELIKCNRLISNTESEYLARDYSRYRNKIIKELQKRGKHGY